MWPIPSEKPGSSSRMDWSLGGIPDWVLTTGLMVLLAFGAYLWRFKFGATEIQLQTSAEREKLLALYEKRIDHLEEDAQRKDDRIRWLEAENTQLMRRVDKLEEANGATRA